MGKRKEGGEREGEEREKSSGTERGGEREEEGGSAARMSVRGGDVGRGREKGREVT